MKNEVTNKHVVAYILGDGVLYHDIVEVAGDQEAQVWDQDSLNPVGSIVSDGNRFNVTLVNDRLESHSFSLDFSEADRLFRMLRAMQPHRKHCDENTWELKL